MAFRYDNPKADAVNYASCQCEVQDGKVKSTVISFKELYKGAFDELNTVYDNIDKTVAEIKGLRKSESRYDTLVAIHDYMCEHLTYGSVFLEGEFPYGFTNVDIATPMFGGGNAQGKPICGGYSTAFHVLCLEFAIPCYTVIGEVVGFDQEFSEGGG